MQVVTREDVEAIKIIVNEFLMNRSLLVNKSLRIRKTGGWFLGDQLCKSYKYRRTS